MRDRTKETFSIGIVKQRDTKMLCALSLAPCVCSSLHLRLFSYGQKWNIKYRDVHYSEMVHFKWISLYNNCKMLHSNHLENGEQEFVCMNEVQQRTALNSIKHKYAIGFSTFQTLYIFDYYYYYLRILNHLQPVFPHILLIHLKWISTTFVSLHFVCVCSAVECACF